jgi:hypothetical protein
MYETTSGVFVLFELFFRGSLQTSNYSITGTKNTIRNQSGLTKSRCINMMYDEGFYEMAFVLDSLVKYAEFDLLDELVE